MRFSDAVRDMYRDITSKGLRPAAWIMDEAALSQLRREAATDHIDVPSITSPLTFLGVPIEIVAIQGGAQADYIPSQRRFAPCQRLDREKGKQWDVFDLDGVEALNGTFASKGEAAEAALVLERERGSDSLHPLTSQP